MGGIANKRPNIVLIMADDQFRGGVNFLGGKSFTPTMNKLADQGIFFSQAHVTTAVCAPSRYSLLTGRDPY